MKNIFLTGEKSIGKSTIINKIIADLDMNIGGYVTEREISKNIKKFYIKSLQNNKLYPFAKVNLDNLEKEVRIDSFKYEIPNFLDKDMEECHIIILDELGFMENDIGNFTSKIYDILDSSLLVVGVLKDFDCEFLNTIRNRKDCMIIEVTEDNREFISKKVVKIIKSNW